MPKYIPQKLKIKAWAEADRPREKLLLKGKFNLSDAELLAILLGSGSKEETAVGLAKLILQSVDQNLNELGKCRVADLQQFKGMGEAKSITVVAALELGRRRQFTDVQSKPQVRSSKDAFNALAPILLDLDHEEFWVLFLNRANKITQKVRVSKGGISGTVVDARVVFRQALEGKATSIILAHNHPSGNLQPSQADIDLTKKLRKAGEMIDIAILDHLIISEKGYYSFADEGSF